MSTVSPVEHILPGQTSQLDPFVLEYLDNLIQEYVQSRSIEGQVSTSKGLYEACKDFLQDLDVAEDKFLNAVDQLVNGNEKQSSDSAEQAPHGLTDEGIKRCESEERGNGEEPAEVIPEHNHEEPTQNRQQDQTRGRKGQGPAKQPSSSAAKPCHEPKASRLDDQSGGSKKPASKNSENKAQSSICVAGAGGAHRKQRQVACSSPTDTVKELFRVAGASEPDPTILEYILSLTDDYIGGADLDETKDASGEREELRETILGVAPDLAPLLAEAEPFQFFLRRMRVLSEQRAAAEAASRAPGRAKSAKKQAAEERAVPDEAEAEAEKQRRAAEEEEMRRKARDEAWVAESAELRLLTEMFSQCSVSQLKRQLDAAAGDLQEAIERTVDDMEFEEQLVSSDELQAERAAYEEEAKQALRERALKYYSQVREAERGETGKKTDPRAALSKSAAFDRQVSAQLSGDLPRLRYIEGQVVSHRGERFIMEKTKNAVPDDPKSYIGLKIKSKKKGGPSPNFK